jgi:phage-related protein
MSAADKRLVWLASALKDLQRMPPEVRRVAGYALRVAQEGGHAEHAFRMTGDLRDVVEIAADDDSGKSTFRVFYTSAIGDVVYVLDAIQKKSKRGIATPRADLDRIRKRLKAAREYHDS